MNAQTSPSTQFGHAVPRVAEALSQFSRNFPGLLAILGFAATLLAPAPAMSQVLGTASNFAVLAGTTVTCIGATTVTGDLGVDPGAAQVGFPVPCTDIGTIHLADAVALQAQTDNTNAFGVLSGLPCGFNIPAQLGGQTYGPGVYCPIAGDFDLTGILTLTTPGLYVFKTGAGLTTSAGGTSSVNLGTASPCDLWWTVPSSATIGSGSGMAGNILALTAISIGTGASLQGRALAQTAQVSLDGNAVTECFGGTAPGFLVLAPAIPPTLAKAFSPATIGAGGVSTLTVTLNNPDPAVATLTAPLVDTLPGGVVIAATPNVSTTCGVGVPVAVAGSSTVTLPLGSTIPANGSCTLTVDVTSAAAGSFINTLPAGALVTSNGNNAAPAVATLLVGAGGGNIPTLSEWAMIMLAALLAIAGFAALRRRAR